MKKILLGVALAILFTSSLSAKSQQYGHNLSNWKQKAFELTPYFKRWFGYSY